MKYNILYIGLDGFPYGSAPIQRQLLMAKGLSTKESSWIIISRFGIGDNQQFDISKSGVFEGVCYKYASILTYRHRNFLIRNANKLVGAFVESYIFLKQHKIGEKNVFLCARTTFLRTLYYRLISFLLGYKLIVDINEAHSLINKKNIKIRLNDIFYDNYICYLCDGIIVISEFLKEYMLSKRKGIKIIKIPVICDIKRIHSIKGHNYHKKYFLYCTSVSYIDSIIFILNAYEPLKNKINLILVLSGRDQTSNRIIIDYINDHNLNETVEIIRGLQYDVLISYYKGAEGLLIPLPETKQHAARFPHKIGEYAASGKPIITNKWGELLNYFTAESAIILDRYDENLYTQALNKVLNNDFQSYVGMNAQSIASKFFDNLTVFEKMLPLLK